MYYNRGYRRVESGSSTFLGHSHLYRIIGVSGLVYVRTFHVDSSYNRKNKLVTRDFESERGLIPQSTSLLGFETVIFFSFLSLFLLNSLEIGLRS